MKKLVTFSIIVLVALSASYAESAEDFDYHPSIDGRMKQFNSQVERIVANANRQIDRLEAQLIQDLSRTLKTHTNRGKLQDAIAVENEVRRLVVDGVTVGVVTNTDETINVLVGEWQWVGSGDWQGTRIVFNANRTARATDVKTGNSTSGNWEKISDNQYVVSWKKWKTKETVTIAPIGGTADIVNQGGFRFTGKRIK